jgi:TPR repeat protein
VTARWSSIFFFLLIFGLIACAAQDSGNQGKLPSTGFKAISAVDVHSQSQGISIEITASAPFIPQALQLTGPDRLVFDFPGYQLRGPNRSIPVDNGPVRQLRVSLFSFTPPVTRVVVDLKEPLKFEIAPRGNKIVIEIALPNGIPANGLTATGASNNGASKSPDFFKPPNTSPALSITTDNHAATAVEVPNARAQPAIRVGIASRPSAIALQARAKALSVIDLQPLEDKARTGDPESETTLALAYHAGVLLKKDDAEALRLLHKAADHNYMAAEDALGIFYESGIGIAHPAPDDAMQWFQKARQQGSLDAITNIALMYADGIGVPKDPAKAFTWFRQAADAGEGAAQYNLALMYAHGEGTARDYKQFVRWLTAASEKNIVPAIMDLAAFNVHPLDDTMPDVERAIHLYEKAAELGNDRAPAILGNIYATSNSGKPDFEQSVKWYRKAADMGQKDGEYGLGIRYAFGQGVPQELQEARRLFTAAADQGLAPAQYNLATICEEGNGTPVDRACATRYYRLAADQGMAKAQFRLGRMLANSKETDTDRVSAYKWLMLAQASVKESSPVLNDLRKSMSEQEISAADHEVDQWRIAHPENRQ